jgi:hypothetical protein
MNAAQYEELLSMLNDIGFRLQRLEKRMFPASAEAPAASKPQAAAPAPVQQPAAYEVATDEDLDGQYGNPEVRKDPPRWSGQSHIGCRYSECPPEYLETLAGFLMWKAGKDDEKDERDSKGNLKSKWSRLDAARARGWAARIRGGSGAYRSTAHTSSKEAREQREASGYQPPAQPEPPPLDDGAFVGDDDIPF